MTPELLKQIEQEAEQYASSKHGYVRDIWKQAYIDGRRVQAARVEELEQWKKEVTALIEPIIDYGQPHAPLGESITKWVLNQAKRAEELEREVERLNSIIIANLDEPDPSVLVEDAEAWALSLVCTEMIDENGNVFQTAKHLPVYDNYEEALRISKEKGCIVIGLK